MTRLLLIRHAESEWNAQKRWQGRADPPLSETGRTEARRAAEALRDAIDVVYASPQIRAFDTARIIASELGIEVVGTDDGLREIDVGAFSGLTIDEVETRYAVEVAEWRSGDLDYAPPGGESRRDLVARVLGALHRIAERCETRRVLVVTHGGVIGGLERHIGVHPGVGADHLTGRWFELDDRLHADDERTALIADAHEPSAEAR